MSFEPIGAITVVVGLFCLLLGRESVSVEPDLRVFKVSARGLERPRPAIEQKSGHLHRTMDVNVFGPWQAIQHALPLMQERGGGAVVNLDRKSTRLNSSHTDISRMPSSA